VSCLHTSCAHKVALERDGETERKIEREKERERENKREIDRECVCVCVCMRACELMFSHAVCTRSDIQ